MIAGITYYQDVHGRGWKRYANPIDEEQLPETTLIESSFLLNNPLKIIISICLFHDGVRHRCILAFYFLIEYLSF